MLLYTLMEASYQGGPSFSGVPTRANQGENEHRKRIKPEPAGLVLSNLPYVPHSADD